MRFVLFICLMSVLGGAKATSEKIGEQGRESAQKSRQILIQMAHYPRIRAGIKAIISDAQIPAASRSDRAMQHVLEQKNIIFPPANPLLPDQERQYLTECLRLYDLELIAYRVSQYPTMNNVDHQKQVRDYLGPIISKQFFIDNNEDHMLPLGYVVQETSKILKSCVDMLPERDPQLVNVVAITMVRSFVKYLEELSAVNTPMNRDAWRILRLIPNETMFMPENHAGIYKYMKLAIEGLDLRNKELRMGAYGVLGRIALAGLKDQTCDNVLSAYNHITAYNIYVFNSKNFRNVPYGFTYLLNVFLNNHLYDIAADKKKWAPFLFKAFSGFKPYYGTAENFDAQYVEFESSIGSELIEEMNHQKQLFLQNYDQFKKDIIDVGFKLAKKNNKRLNTYSSKGAIQRHINQEYEDTRNTIIRLLKDYKSDDSSGDSGSEAESETDSAEELISFGRQNIAQKARIKLEQQAQQKIAIYDAMLTDLRSILGVQLYLNEDLKPLRELMENTNRLIGAIKDKGSFDVTLNDELSEAYEKFSKLYKVQIELHQKAMKEQATGSAPLGDEISANVLSPVNHKAEIMQKIKDDETTGKAKLERAEKLKAEKMASRADKQEAYKQMEEKSKNSSGNSSETSSEDHTPDSSLNRIAGFKNKQTKNIYDTQTDQWNGKAVRLLNLLSQATSIHELSQMDLGDAHLEKLQLKLVKIGEVFCETWSLRINDKYRLTFIWNGETHKSHKVWIGDYH